MKKPGRNDPCICGSGKKFKKCCEGKLIGKKFLAEDLTQKLSGKFNLTTIFQDNTRVSKEEKPPEKQEKPPEENKTTDESS